MSVWAREVAGWLLLAAGLGVFATAAWMLLLGLPIEGSTMTFIGFIVFRGGVHLLKVATAARYADLAARPPVPAPRRTGR
jgi:hypothetical protein